MNDTDKPWAEKWDLLEEIASDEHGATYLVQNQRDASSFGVLKLLALTEDPRARKRIRAEVETLKLLTEKGAAVPAVLNANTDRANDKNVPLFFVTDWIDGQTLDEYVRHREYLAIEEALDVVTQVANVVAIGHAEGLGHGLLNPDNVLVRLDDNDAKDVVVIGYRSSPSSSANLSHRPARERDGSEFLHVPENNLDGGRRRDLRVDVAQLCGLLFFCLTGRYPQFLRDSDRRPPHQRPGIRFAGLADDSHELKLLEALFDRGFRPAVADQFQSVDEFLCELAAIRSCYETEEPSLSVVAQRESHVIRLHDPVTKLEHLKPRIPALYDQLIAAIGTTYKGEYLGLFKVKFRSVNLSTNRASALLGLEWMHPYNRVWMLTVPPHDRIREVTYGLGVSGNELQVFRYLRNANPGEWQSPEFLVAYPIDRTPDFGGIVRDFKRWLHSSMTALRAEIVPGTSLVTTPVVVDRAARKDARRDTLPTAPRPAILRQLSSTHGQQDAAAL